MSVYTAKWRDDEGVHRHGKFEDLAAAAALFGALDEDLKPYDKHILNEAGDVVWREA